MKRAAAVEILCIYLSRARAAKARSELPPSIPIHGQIPGFRETHAIKVPPELPRSGGLSAAAGPRGRFQPGSGTLPQRTPRVVQRASWAGTPGLHVGHVPKESKPSTPNPGFHVIQVSAIPHLEDTAPLLLSANSNKIRREITAINEMFASYKIVYVN